jgi:Domain of unknown function (DUF5916)/Carbohydrate family 9 binding domain-like
MMVKQLLCLVGALFAFCTALAAQSNSSSPSPTPAASPASSAKTTANQLAPGAKRTVVIPPEKAKPIVVPRFDKPPVIDGKLDDEVWKQAVVLRDFLQTSPGDNIAPSKPTEMMIGYDARTFYMAFHCYDEPDKIRATVAKRDAVFDEDNVRVFLDTFNDQRRAYVLGFNPLGVQQDGIMTEGSGTDFSVDIVMESKGVITSDGWTLEVAIPFKSLRYEAGKGKLWGFHAWRNIDRFNDEIDSWMPNSRDISSQLSQEGHLTGLEGISTERTLEVIPSLTVSETGKRVPALVSDPNGLNQGRILNQPLHFDPGVTVKFGLTPTVTLDFTLNPDFAQVEADQTVVTANQRFPIFFEEKRPFFLEGIDIFRTQIQAVHTRAIVNPRVAAKLTGKRGRNTFGFLIASDKAPGNFTEEEKTDPVNQRFVDRKAYVGILRLKRDIGGKDSYVGLLATSYDFVEKHNQLGGIDGRFRIDPKSVASFQVLGTTSRRCFFEPALSTHRPGPSDGCFAGYDAPNSPAETRNYFRTGNGLGYAFNYDVTGRNFGWDYNASGQTQDYRADVGFTRRLNTNNQGFFVRFSNDPKPKAKLVSWRLTNGTEANFDWQGRMQNWGTNPQISLQLQHNTNLEMGVNYGYERLFESEFGQKRTATQTGVLFGGPERSTYQHGVFTGVSSNPSKKYSGYLFLSLGHNSFDFDFGASPKYPRVSPPALAAEAATAAGLCDPRKGPPPAVCSAAQDPGPGKSLDISAGFSYQPTNELSTSLDYTKSRLRRNDTGQLAFDENIFSLHSTYQFTRFVFLRARVDYDTLASDVRGQFLFGWTPNPGTAFYLGYNDDLIRNGFNPFTGQLEPGFRRNGRTFFIKLSYLFRRSFGH